MSVLTQINDAFQRSVTKPGSALLKSMWQFHLLLPLALLTLSACSSSEALWPTATDKRHPNPCQEIAKNNDLTPAEKNKVFRIDEGKFRCKDISNHAFVTGLYGYVRAADTGADIKDKLAEQREFDSIFSGLREYLENELPENEPLEIMIFAHGGMVTAENGIKIAGDLAPVLLQDGYYPIFPIWRADPASAYGDYLFRVNSRGQPSERNKFLLSPLRLTEDLLSGVIRTPENLVVQGERFNDTILRNDTDYFLPRSSCSGNADSDAIACRYAKNQFSESDIIELYSSVSPNAPHNSYFDNVILPDFPDSDKSIADPNNSSRRPPQTTLYYNNPAYVAVRWFVAPTFVGGPGPNIWSNLVRNTRFAVYSDNKKTVPLTDRSQYVENHRFVSEPLHHCAIEKSYYAEVAQRPLYEAGERGAVSLFFDRLECELGIDQNSQTTALEKDCSDQRGDPLKERHCRGLVNITFAGHSMGTIVANEIISQHPSLPWKNVIYMAAAASIRDTNYHLTPVLRANPDIRFYNTMLHPLAEARELMQIPGRAFGIFPPYTIPPKGIAPHGSLLEWIDEMFEGPRSPDQRTIGKWHNVQTTKEVFPIDVQKQMTFHVFPNQWKTHDLDYFDRQCAITTAQKDRWNTHDRAKKKVKRCHPVQHVQFNNYSFWRNNYILSYKFSDLMGMRIGRDSEQEDSEIDEKGNETVKNEQSEQSLR